MYTKTEWSIRKSPTGRIGIYIEKFGFVVFAVSDTGDKDVRKTIDESLRLITAAPSLLEACKMALEEFKDRLEYYEAIGEEDYITLIKEQIKQLETAINKGIGE